MYDKAIRDEDHFHTVYEYIKSNPIKAELEDQKERFYGIYPAFPVIYTYDLVKVPIHGAYIEYQLYLYRYNYTYIQKLAVPIFGRLKSIGIILRECRLFTSATTFIPKTSI